VPDRHETESEYTTDRRIPGAFEGETVTRRRFMTASAHTYGGLAVMAFTLPSLAFALGPIFEAHDQPWQDVGAAEEFDDKSYVPKTIMIASGVGEAGKSTVYMRRNDPKVDLEPKDEYNEFIAVSTRCAHLGCPVRYVPAAERFICPCHGGVYTFRGEVDGGPPVRPLDRFYTRKRGDRVEIGPRFSVNREIKRFSPRDPGQALDGIGQYMYPARPSIRKLPNT